MKKSMRKRGEDSCYRLYIIRGDWFRRLVSSMFNVQCNTQ